MSKQPKTSAATPTQATTAAREPAVQWLSAPETHDYPAALSYLSLIVDPEAGRRIVTALQTAGAQTFKAKDILRAARLELLPRTDAHVAGDLEKIKRGKALSPVLLVRGNLVAGVPAQIADGYHRVCAAYYTDENTDIPVRIADAG